MGKMNKPNDNNPSEILERKNTAQKVRSLFQSAPDVFVITDSNGKILTANNELEKLFGYSEDEIIGKNLCFLFPERFQARHELTIISCFKNSSSQTIGSNSELSGLRKNGSEFFVEVSLNHLTVNNEESVIAIIRDITEEKRSNDNLQLSEQRYQKLTDISPIGIFYTNAEGKTTYVNSKWCEISGLSFKDALGFGWINAVHPDDRMKLLDDWEKSVKTFSDSMIDYRFIRNDGSIAWVIGKAVPETNLSGKIIGYIGTIIDITERKQAEEELRREQILLRTLIDNLPDVIYIKDKSCKKVVANLADVRNMGFQKESDVLGKDDFDLFPKEIAEQFFKDDQSVIQSGVPMLNKEELLVDSGDNKKWLLTSKIPLFDEKGNISGLVGIGHDITEKKKVEEALKKNEHLLKESQKVAKLGHYSLDILTGIWKSSDVLNEIFGIDKNYQTDVEGWSKILHSSYRERMKAYLINDVIAKHQRFDSEYKIVRINDKQIRWVHGIGELEFDKNGNPILMIGTIQDITDRKKTEKELRESEERFRSLYENSTLGIYRTTPNGKILLANPALVKILGFDSFDDLAKVNLSKEGFETSNERIFFIEKIEKDGEVKGLETKWKKKDGTFVYINESARAVRDSNGKTIYYDGIIEDITVRKKAEAALRTSQNQLSNALEIAQLGPWEYDVLSDQFTFNDQFYKLFHTNVQQVGGYNMSSADYVHRFVYPDDIPLVGKEIKNSIETTDPDFSTQLEHRILYTDGEIGFITVRIFVVKDKRGRTIKTYGVNQDITERKLAENKIKQSEQDYRRLFENAHDAIFILNTEDEVILHVNERACKLYGFSKSEFIGMSLEKITKNLSAGKEKIEKILTDGFISSFETTQYTKQKKELVFEVNASLIDYKGKKAILSLNHNITERKAFEEELKRSEKKYRNIFNNSPIGIYRTTPDGKILDVNPAILEMLGYSSIEELKKINLEYEKSYGQSSSRPKFKELMEENGNVKGFESTWIRKDNSEVHVRENASVISDDLGNVLYYDGTVEDITERKKAEQEIIAAKEKAEEMNRLKSTFLANMSHELRTPLVGIVGCSEFLCTDLKDPELKEMAETIFNSSKRLSETLNLILDLSKIESDKIELTPEKFDLITASTEIVNSFKEFANRKGIYLKSEFESPKFIVNLDIRAVRSIISNLVNNAIKFTNTGGVTINLSSEKVNDKDFVVIKVIDTGVGISKENHNLIFEEFRQVSEGLDRNFQGSGLGLSITKKFVEKLHGTINIYSELSKGSTFTVKLPLSSDELISIESESKKEIKPLQFNYNPSILVVDDDENINKILKNYLPSEFDINSVENGYDALGLIRQKKFDVIFMDINLKKDLDGKQAAQEIRKIKDYEDTPIVACTAYAMEGDKEEFLSAGCSHYLSKPFSKEEILLLLDEILQLSAKTEKKCT